MHANDIDTSCVARVFNSVGTVGAGFYVAEEVLITSAHVVNLALGVDAEDKDSKVGEEISVELPIGSANECRATVSRWKSPTSSDLAILDLPNVPGSATAPHAIWFGRGFKRPVEVIGWGFPEITDRDAQPAGGIVSNKTASGRLLIAPRPEDLANAASLPLLSIGWSGTPVWAEVGGQPRVIGLLTHAKGGRRPLAAVLPFHQVTRALYPGSARRASTAWYCDRFRSELLESFISDLRRLRPEGLTDAVCNSVFDHLSDMEDKLSGLYYGGERHGDSWETAPYRQMRQLKEAYKKWNDATSPEERGALIDAVVDERAKLTYQLSQVRSLEIIANQRDSERVFRGLVADFLSLTSAHPAQFQALRRSAVRLRKKERQAA